MVPVEFVDRQLWVRVRLEVIGGEVLNMPRRDVAQAVAFPPHLNPLALLPRHSSSRAEVVVWSAGLLLNRASGLRQQSDESV